MYIRVHANTRAEERRREFFFNPLRADAVQPNI
jgi:hypothetical protein